MLGQTANCPLCVVLLLNRSACRLNPTHQSTRAPWTVSAWHWRRKAYVHLVFILRRSRISGSSSQDLWLLEGIANRCSIAPLVQCQLACWTLQRSYFSLDGHRYLVCFRLLCFALPLCMSMCFCFISRILNFLRMCERDSLRGVLHHQVPGSPRKIIIIFLTIFFSAHTISSTTLKRTITTAMRSCLPLTELLDAGSREATKPRLFLSVRTVVILVSGC